MFLVALLFLIATVSACDIAPLNECLTGSLIPGSTTTACKCWENFLAENTNCSYVQYTAAYTAAHAFCTSATFSFTPHSCLEALTVYHSCTVNLAGTTQSTCDCYNSFQTSAATLCVSDTEKASGYAICAAAKAGCSSLECNFDCSVISNMINKETSTSFEVCIQNTADACSCYTQATEKVISLTDDCEVAAEFELKACVTAQLSCDSLSSEHKCVATTAKLAIPDIAGLFTSEKDKFIAKWNAALTTDSITINSADHTTNGDAEIVFTLKISFDETKKSLDQVVASIKKEFSLSIGLAESDLEGQAQVDGAKRSLLATGATVTMTGTNSPPNGASTLSIVMIPLIVMSGVFHYFF